MHPSPDSFQAIPGVGPKIAKYIWELGYQDVAELKDEDPEEMYLRFCALKGKEVDRCLLYVFRTAVYYASHDTHDPDRLQWWNWKD